MRLIFIKIFRTFHRWKRQVLNDNIDKYDSKNNSMNGESISNFDRSRFYEERDSSYYLLMDSEILENIQLIDLIGKCPAEHCSGKVKHYNDFQGKQGLSSKLEFSFTDCSWSNVCFTSKKVSKASVGKTSFNVKICMFLQSYVKMGMDVQAYSLFVVT